MQRMKIVCVVSAIKPIDFNTFNTVVIFKNEGMSVYASMHKLRMAEL